MGLSEVRMLAPPPGRSFARRLALAYFYLMVATLAVTFVAHVAILVSGAVTGNGLVRDGGTTDGVRYWVNAGKPPRPREVGAAYYRSASTVEAVRAYGVLALLTQITLAAIVRGTVEAVRSLGHLRFEPREKPSRLR